MAIITLKEYAERHGKNAEGLRQKAKRGGFKTAHMLGRQWVIDEDETLEDGRISTGRYIGLHTTKK